jgi:DNA-binding transcriptional LysR family regulator
MRAAGGKKFHRKPPAHRRNRAGGAGAAQIGQIGENRSRPFVLEDLSVLNGEEIATTDKSSRFRNMTDTYLARVGVRRTLFTNARTPLLCYRVTKQKECLSLIPDTYVREDKDIFTFSLSPRLYWNLSVFTRSDSYLSKAEKHFIEICREQIHI